MKNKIIDALLKLDQSNEDHWTADGLPKVDALEIEGVTRAQISEAAPHFTKENPVIETPAEVQDKAEAKAVEEAELDIDGKIAAQQEVVERKAKVLETVRREYDKEILALDELILEKAGSRKGRQPQHDIMDYLEAQKRRREARAGV